MSLEMTWRQIICGLTILYFQCKASEAISFTKADALKLPQL